MYVSQPYGKAVLPLRSRSFRSQLMANLRSTPRCASMCEWIITREMLAAACLLLYRFLLQRTDLSRALLHKAFARFPWLIEVVCKDFSFESACTRSASCRLFGNSHSGDLGNHPGVCTTRALPLLWESNYAQCPMGDCRRGIGHMGPCDSYVSTAILRISNYELHPPACRFEGVLCCRLIKHPDGSLSPGMGMHKCLLPDAHLGLCLNISSTHNLAEDMCHPNYRVQLFKLWDVGWIVSDRPGGMRVYFIGYIFCGRTC